jgi:hypothetical protein
LSDEIDTESLDGDGADDKYCQEDEEKRKGAMR